ncbi:hypothetical protein [Streptomyces albipurpureus]|uniref:Integral membrane protein n=1 Tax=Streptomyces albipurpureus TaxID=2897419 RepID=A0ABT0UPY7_9ACTN|nr:hypothetical protein [Streptomyces sp. CWNU-1]MCM2390524.1 hypothetical protein [Streptomyces sp. CWNU-1]
MTANTQDGVTVGGLLVAEYERIKAEQQARIGFRDNLLYATLASVAAVIAALLQTDGRTALLLLLPPVSVLLGWTYLVNDEKISAIGRYVRMELSPRLLAIAEVNEPAGQQATVFGWEWAHREDQRRVTRKRLQLAVDLTTFCVCPLAALVLYGVQGPHTVLLIAVAVVETAAVITLAVQLVVYADLRRGAG